MALSPMMQQYIKIKENYSDVLLFYRLGDFYEMFFDDAVTASKELDLILTGRDCGLTERAPMCGVPFHAVDGYIAKLIEKGYKVAICEQTSIPTKGKGVVDREVIRIITPGTVTDSASLIEDRNNYLVSVYLKENDAGISWIDVSTGEFNHAYIEAPIAVKLNDLLSKINPSEIICNSEMLERSLELSIVKLNSVCRFSQYRDEYFEYDSATVSIKKYLSEPAIKMLTNKKLCVNSAGALIEYLNETQKRSLDNINEIIIDDQSKYMQIDAVARKTLELTESAQSTNKRGSLYWLIDKTSTAMGSRMLRRFLNEPSIDQKVINKRLDSAEELLDDILRDKIVEKLKKIHDIERILGKISFDISPKGLLGLLQSLNQLPGLKECLNTVKTPLLNEINNNIKTFYSLTNILSSAIKEDCPSFARDGNIIKDSFDAKLDEYRALSTNAVGIIAKLERDEKEETGIKNLKIAYNKVFGYYIEITKSQVDLVPYRYIRKQTISTGERYTTPELKELEEKVLSASELILAREMEIYKSIILEIKKYIKEIQNTSRFLAMLDCIASFSSCAKEYNFCKPVINDDIKHIKIIEGRHCVVEKLLKNENFVPNDCILDEKENKIMIITGPNMSGKSVYMRQVAITTILAHIGSFVPAKSAEISITDKIFTRVGASDDLSSGRSTFMVEMSEMSNIINNVTPKSLVLLDEVGRGTSTYDGLSIAWSIVEYFSNLTSKILFSTHYHELTELEGVICGIKNYKLSIKEIGNSIIFLRKLMRGSANKSFGIEVAGIAGLPGSILKRAKEILKMLESSDIGKQTKNNTSLELSYSQSAADEIISILRDLDINNISPRFALDILNDLIEKTELRNNE